jgi:glycosyltransferase involved in cell wall biosynthesis
MQSGLLKISVVAGCYNEQENVEELYAQVKAVFDELGRYEFEVIFIDNASSDNTVGVLRRLAASDRRVKVIVNARNFGAIRSGYYALTQAGGDAVVAMASDLQDPPALIKDFVAQWEQGYKVVLAIKTSTHESQLFHFVRSAYYKMVKRLSETELNDHSTGFGLYDRQVIEILRKIDDPYPYFRGLISEIGFESAKVPFTQPQRKRGITKNNFYTLYDLAMLGITKHSTLPLRLATMSGFALSILSLLTGIGYLVYKLLFWDLFSAGMAPVVIGLFLFCSVQLFFIGILGEYIGVILTHVRKLPLVVEKERINF